MNSIEMVPEKDQHRLHKLHPIRTPQLQISQSFGFTLHQTPQQTCRGRVHTGTMLRHFIAKQPTANIEPSSIAIFVAGIKPQIGR